MNWKMTLTSLSTAGLLLAPLAAHADHYDRDDDDVNFNVNVQVPVPPPGQPGVPCHHEAPPPPMPPPGNPGPAGHYEMRTVNEWVPGRYTQVYVPGSCYHRGHGWKFHPQFCTAGYYAQQWQPGRYEPRQEWVFVDAYGYVQPAPNGPDGYPQYGGATFGAQR